MIIQEEAEITWTVSQEKFSEVHKYLMEGIKLIEPDCSPWCPLGEEVNGYKLENRKFHLGVF